MAEEAPKSVISKTEAWMSSIASLGVLLTAYVSHIEGAPTWVALGVCVLLTGIFAFFKTPLAAKDKPGVKTKTFWTAIVVIVASIATAVSEIDIAGIPAKVTQVAGMIASAAMALGYNIWRYKRKTNGGGDGP